MHREVEGYLEGLVVGQGARIGQPFEVLPWQRRFLRGALAPGRFSSALTLGRGGGKTTFVAALVCAAADGLLAAPNSEVVIVAASLRQAGITFRHVQRFLAARIGEYKVYDAVNRQALYNPANGILVELKGANPATLHGVAPSLVIVDEVAQIHLNKLPQIMAALDTSLGKVPNSRLWMIGTRAATTDHPFEVALGTADYSQVHAARPADPPFWKRTWERACPSLRAPGFEPLLEKIRSEAKRARSSEDALASFRALRLNQGVPDTVAACLVEADVWLRAEGDVPAKGPCVWGVDLGGTAASSAVAAYRPVTGRLDCLAAFPGAGMRLGARGLRDGVGRLYKDMYKRGELLQTAGHAVDVRELLREALNRFGRPVAVAADRWREGDLRDGLMGAGVPTAALSLRGQGFKDGGEDVRIFRRAIIERKARPLVSLLLRSAMAEARVVTDPAGNSKLAKGSQGGRRARARDDACAAAILAVAEGVRRGSTMRRRPLRFAVTK